MRRTLGARRPFSRPLLPRFRSGTIPAIAQRALVRRCGRRNVVSTHVHADRVVWRLRKHPLIAGDVTVVLSR